jgi:single-strand DNA-binding protein
MAPMNDARFTGNLTRDPEAKAMSNGKLRCTFTLAVTRPYTNQQGQRDADFIQFVAYEKNAELAQKYLAKGRKILVISHVKTGSYEKDGKRIYTTEFVVDKIEFLSSAQQDNQSAAPAEQPPQSYANQGFQQVDDDELPF